MLSDFKAFIMRGNVLDLAVAVIIGGAFGAIVDSLVKDIVMPLLGLVTGGLNFTDMLISLDGKTYPTLQAAKAAGAATINYGQFIQAVISFIVIAFVIYMLVRAANTMQRLGGKNKEPEAPTERDCPYCLSSIPIKATRCAHCTSVVDAV